MKIFGKNKNPPAGGKKVITFGTFDIFHPGHAYYLRKAKKLGNYLVTIVARDETVKKVKERAPEQNEEERVENIQKYKTADKVMLGSLGNKYEVIKECCPDIIALGYDQEVDEEELKNKLEELGLGHCKIKRIKAFKPEIYKSSKLKNLD